MSRDRWVTANLLIQWSARGAIICYHSYISRPLQGVSCILTRVRVTYSRKWVATSDKSAMKGRWYFKFSDSASWRCLQDSAYAYVCACISVCVSACLCVCVFVSIKYLNRRSGKPSGRLRFESRVEEHTSPSRPRCRKWVPDSTERWGKKTREKERRQAPLSQKKLTPRKGRFITP